MRILLASRTLVVAIIIAGASVIAAQPAPTVDFSGTWMLDTYLSDNPEQVSAAIRADVGQGGGDELFGEAGDAGGARGGGPGRRRGNGRARGDGGAVRPPNAEQQQRIDDLTAPLRYPPPTLTIAQTPAALTFTEAPARTRTLDASGKREKQTIGSTAVDVTTRWEGPQLVSEQDLGGGRMLRYTYAIVPTTKQLLIRVAIDRTPGRPGPFEIRIVYNRAGA